MTGIPQVQRRLAPARASVGCGERCRSSAHVMEVGVRLAMHRRRFSEGIRFIGRLQSRSKQAGWEVSHGGREGLPLLRAYLPVIYHQYIRNIAKIHYQKKDIGFARRTSTQTQGGGTMGASWTLGSWLLVVVLPILTCVVLYDQYRKYGR